MREHLISALMFLCLCVHSSLTESNPRAGASYVLNGTYGGEHGPILGLTHYSTGRIAISSLSSSPGTGGFWKQFGPHTYEQATTLNKRKFGGRDSLEVPFEVEDSSYLGGSNFTLLLRKQVARPIQIDEIVLVGANSREKITQDLESYSYIGIVEEKPVCSVTARVHDRQLYATIRCDDKTVYIEPGSKFFPSVDISFVIVYSDEDVNPVMLKRFGLHKPGLDLSGTAQTQRRKRRSTVKTVKSCSLHVVIDPPYYQQVGLSNVSLIADMVVDHVMESKRIFTSTDFDGDSFPDNVGFHIAKLEIYTSVNSPGYKLSQDKLESDNYLMNFSEYDFSDSCLAVLITNHDFGEGVIGLAWVADSSEYGNPGGICQQPVLLQDRGETPYSLNSLFITATNYGARLADIVSFLTLAHELGHAFGSPHDDINDKNCAPNGQVGHYLMYPYSTDGKLPNHRLFSSCSRNYINPVIQNKGSCLQERKATSCGDLVVDPGEMCDCGVPDFCSHVDPCCTPPGGDGKDQECSVRTSAGYVCSPRSSPCCNQSCQYVPASQHMLCSPVSECLNATYCPGDNATCPAPTRVADGTACNGGKGTCLDGRCVGEPCLRGGYKACQCGEQPRLCSVCCLYKGECRPADALNLTKQELYLGPGEACNNYTGYCVQNHTCVTVVDDSAGQALEEWLVISISTSVQLFLLNYLSLMIVAASPVVFVIVACVARARKLQRVRMEADLASRSVSLCERAQSELAGLDEKKKQVKEIYEQKVKQVQERKVMDTAVAVARLTTFFPHAQPAQLEEAIRESPNEETAVATLLLRGYSMRRLVE